MSRLSDIDHPRPAVHLSQVFEHGLRHLAWWCARTRRSTTCSRIGRALERVRAGAVPRVRPRTRVL